MTLPQDNPPTLPLEGVDPEPVFHSPWDETGFARRVYLARRRHYRSREAAERETGISVSAWESYETGERVPRSDTLKLLCEKLRVSADWLLWGSEPPDFPSPPPG